MRQYVDFETPSGKPIAIDVDTVAYVLQSKTSYVSLFLDLKSETREVLVVGDVAEVMFKVRNPDKKLRDRLQEIHAKAEAKALEPKEVIRSTEEIETTVQDGITATNLMHKIKRYWQEPDTIHRTAKCMEKTEIKQAVEHAHESDWITGTQAIAKARQEGAALFETVGSIWIARSKTYRIIRARRIFFNSEIEPILIQNW